MNQRRKGFGLVEVILLIAIIAILASTTLPALKQKNKRSQYREITDTVDPLSAIVEKCLGMKRLTTACASTEKLLPFGYSPSLIEANSLIDSIELSLENGHYRLSVTPSASNLIYPFINETHTYSRVAEIIDRNGRPIIEHWNIDPKSGCKTAGLC